MHGVAGPRAWAVNVAEFVPAALNGRLFESCVTVMPRRSAAVYFLFNYSFFRQKWDKAHPRIPRIFFLQIYVRVIQVYRDTPLTRPPPY